MAEAGRHLLVFTDENVNAAWGETILGLLGPALRAGDVFVAPAGESSKSTSMLTACWNWLAERGCRRNDLVAALGGGVVGDLAGFAAATYQRGIGLWQIPTTLLAQVDSSVGGKTAINLAGGKNLVGAFYQPDLVVVDPLTLGTLPSDEYRGGLGEVAKYGLLDADLFALLGNERHAIADRDPEVVADLVRRCIDYKTSVVEEDELDRGRRAVLNLGHTMGHALEVTIGYGSLSHGRAVALGLLVALAVSERTLGLDPEVRGRTRLLLEGWDLPVAIPLPPVGSLLLAAAKDKKVTAGTTGFVGLRRVGEPVWGLPVSTEVVSEALEVIRA
jgi:3-dehydroquinate synthase